VELREIKPAIGEVVAHFGEIDSRSVQRVLAKPDEFLKGTGLKVNLSLPVHVSVTNVTGSTKMKGGPASRVTVFQMPTANVVSIVTFR
jgi:hypothetical protein